MNINRIIYTELFNIMAILSIVAIIFLMLKVQETFGIDLMIAEWKS